MWNEIPHFFDEQYADPSNMAFPVQTSKIDVPTSLFAIKTFVETYLHPYGLAQYWLMDNRGHPIGR